jgi:hypothetical protein
MLPLSNYDENAFLIGIEQFLRPIPCCMFFLLFLRCHFSFFLSANCVIVRSIGTHLSLAEYLLSEVIALRLRSCRPFAKRPHAPPITDPNEAKIYEFFVRRFLYLSP